ncbi:aminoglycoside 3 phosphotransferase choline Kinase family [Fusarium denticulatum]|uniref:Aminoglycoside 3 phosphotransferase choline Kinase family n=1 Tax=Fusarium denticulatum TaxID=48507 RepID=A0A8H5XAP0_9HYPO|nr:aminoglycoside 3 phosphotransferase choline Kinase family [Fusarium denticulatum]
MALQVPTIAEIRASTEILSPPDASAMVVKVGENFAVKFGPTVSLQEAEAFQFISTNTKVPVPEFYASLVEPETGINFIVMEYINAKSLGDLWPTLGVPDRLQITSQLRAALRELRSLEPPSCLGSLNRKALSDGVFWTPDQNPAKSGPFETEDDFNEGILQRLAEHEPQAHLTLLRTLITATLRDHKVKFTHGDLQPKNILVKSTGLNDPPYAIKIIDWEISGWYPEYWEFCNATIAGRFRPEWLDLVQHIMKAYVPEYLMLQTIRSLLFY